MQLESPIYQKILNQNFEIKDVEESRIKGQQQTQTKIQKKREIKLEAKKLKKLNESSSSGVS